MHLMLRNRLDHLEHITAATILHKDHHNKIEEQSQAMFQFTKYDQSLPSFPLAYMVQMYYNDL